jgi:hypothetical protein
MTRRKLLAVSFALVALVGLSAPLHAAKKEKPAAGPQTVTGKSSCATTDGVTKGGNAILLTDSKGRRWVLLGGTDAYRAAQAVRKEGKTMTATYEGQPVIKKDAMGKEYAQVEVTDIKVEG